MVKYPGNQKRAYKAPVSYANRGKFFEDSIIATNNGYLARGMGFIEKVEPTIQITKEKPPNRVEGFKRGKGFVDFFGCCQGRAIAFEAKKTNNRTSFPLSNIKDHQMINLRSWQQQGGIAFFLISFEKLGEVYLVKYDQVNEFWEAAEKGGRKSIPYDYFLMRCDLVKQGRGVPLDYLKCIGI